MIVVMARPTVYDDELRARLLDAAAEVVDRDGPERVSLRDVAQRAGTSTSAVYALFGGKTELLVAVVAHGFASFGASQRAAEHDGLRALGVAYRAWALSHPALYRLMFGGALDHPQPGDAPEGSAATDALAPLMRTLAALAGRSAPTDAGAGNGPVSPALLRDAVAVWAQVHGVVSLELARVAPEETEWDRVYDTVLDAIEGAAARR